MRHIDLTRNPTKVKKTSYSEFWKYQFTRGWTGGVIPPPSIVIHSTLTLHPTDSHSYPHIHPATHSPTHPPNSARYASPIHFTPTPPHLPSPPCAPTQLQHSNPPAPPPPLNPSPHPIDSNISTCPPLRFGCCFLKWFDIHVCAVLLCIL